MAKQGGDRHPRADTQGPYSVELDETRMGSHQHLRTLTTEPACSGNYGGPAVQLNVLHLEQLDT